jgi:hypothetical protein
MQEFRVGDHLYRSRKLNARQQFHVARRLAPLVGQLMSLGPALSQLPTPASDTAPDETAVAATSQAFEGAIEALAMALARIPDNDCDYVLDHCMAVTQRAAGNGGGPAWADIWNERAHRLMFEDIDMPTMMQIAAEVLRDNLSAFFSMLPAAGTPNTAQAQPASLS